MSKQHFFNLTSMKPQKNSANGSRTIVGIKEVPALEGISLECLKLNRNASLEPLWHPNSHKIGYCLQGKVLVSILTPNSHDSFTVGEGEVFFVPKGNYHYVANISEKEAVIIFGLSNAQPDELNVSKALRSLSDSAFASTFQTQPPFFEGLKKSKQDHQSFIHYSSKKAHSDISSHFKFNIKTSNTYLTTKGGYLKAATSQNLPVIQELGIFGFGLNAKGIVEPHWHTNAGELIYVVKGHVRISILSPDGTHDVADVKAGGGGFAPASHFHSIENLSTENAEIIAFFTNREPDYIGIGQAVGLCSNEMLASVFDLSPDYFNAFTPPHAALVIAGG